jgi:hypothetical protein
MEPHNNDTTDKVTFSSDDFLFLEGTIQNYTLDIISKQASSIPSEEHGFVKAAMDEVNLYENLYDTVSHILYIVGIQYLYKSCI